MNSEQIIQKVEEVYQNECNHGRYAQAMKVALAEYERLMRKHFPRWEW